MVERLLLDLSSELSAGLLISRDATVYCTEAIKNREHELIDVRNKTDNATIVDQDCVLCYVLYFHPCAVSSTSLVAQMIDVGA